METLTEEQFRAVIEAVRSMPSNYRPINVADQLEHDWQTYGPGARPASLLYEDSPASEFEWPDESMPH